MEAQVTKRSLSALLAGQQQAGILQPNPAGRPFWIPEENPALQAWNMTASEYCFAVQRATGLDLLHAHQSVFQDSELSLARGMIPFLGCLYRLTHPDADMDEEENTPPLPMEGQPGEAPKPPSPIDLLAFHPDMSSLSTPQSAEAGESIDALNNALFHLLLAPFAAMRQETQPADYKKG